MDTSVIGQFIAQLMEQLTEDWPDGSTISDVAVVVDLIRADGEEILLTACTDKRAWVQRALLDEGLATLDYAEQRADE